MRYARPSLMEDRMSGERIGRRSVLTAAGLVLAHPVFAAPATGKPRVAIQTGRGMIVIELEATKAPLTSANFLRYVDGGRYNGGRFYRASRERGASGGGTIEAGPSESVRRFPPIPHESTTKTGLRHKAGTVSLARNAPGTGTGDFFICASAQPYLDAHPGAASDNQGFAAFGQVVEGMNVVHAILALPTNGKAEIAAMKGQILSPPVAIVSMKRL
jgi:peptidyl-prolyl cis-trans isomerase A (cyclophilin A)